MVHGVDQSAQRFDAFIHGITPRVAKAYANEIPVTPARRKYIPGHNRNVLGNGLVEQYF